MTSSERTIRLDDFTVQQLPPETPEGKAFLAERDRLNARYLAEHGTPSAGTGRLSGTFVYAHPPDYRGRPTLGWSAARWCDLFRELKEIGLGTVILQAAAWLDFQECYYPSDMFRGFTTWNIVEPMLEAVAAEKMTCYLGGVGILYNWDELGVPTKDPSQAVAAAKREVACYREILARYRGHFHGYYLSPETGYHPDPEGWHLRCFHTFFERATNEVKSLTPELPILTSPYTVTCPGRETEAIEYLTRLHGNCPIAACAPQDSIGTRNNLEFLEAGLAIWREVCRRTGAEFWVNCESFCITSYGGPLVAIEPAGPQRFLTQVATAARLGATRLITWEAPTFLTPHGDPAAHRLRDAYAEWSAGTTAGATEGPDHATGDGRTGRGGSPS
jgi:hypothetical protein